MFFRLPKALALALSTSIATASFVSTQDKAQGQVVLGSEGATTARARDVDELGRQTYDGYSVVRFDVDSENKRQELVKLGQVSAGSPSGCWKETSGRGGGGRSEGHISLSSFFTRVTILCCS